MPTVIWILALTCLAQAESADSTHPSLASDHATAAATDDDEPGFRFGAHSFVPGEYVTIRGHDGEQHTLRVVAVSDLR